MIRNVSLSEISDGKFYDLNDMVKVDCNGCQGCHACCQGMGHSIVLDPWDVFQLTIGLSQSFQELLKNSVDLNVVDGIILPNLKMQGEAERCIYLNGEGRCSIHAFRPGICRLFPLGRYWDQNTFWYIHQIHECNYPNKTKIKVQKWIDTPDIKNYHQFVIDWHSLQKDIQSLIQSAKDDKLIKDINMFLLNTFYVEAYNHQIDFYEQFHARLIKMRKLLSVLKTMVTD